MFYEKKIQSFDKLMEEIRRLDSDSGVRVVGTHAKKPAFAFLTRSGRIYTVMVYGRRGKKEPTPGTMLLSKEFGSLEDLDGFLREFGGKGVDAYVY